MVTLYPLLGLILSRPSSALLALPKHLQSEPERPCLWGWARWR